MSDHDEALINVKQAAVVVRTPSSLVDELLTGDHSDVNCDTQSQQSNLDENQVSFEIVNKQTSEEEAGVSGGGVGDEEISTTPNRELKLLLELSKQANLDVNIPRKRKSLIRKRGVKVQYPITAECELDLELPSSEGSKDEDHEGTLKRKKSCNLSETSLDSDDRKMHVKRVSEIIPFKPNKDMFCWRCHKDNVNIACETCPRSYHQKCLKQTIMNPDHWPCPECVSILKAESTNSRSVAMKGMTLEHLCSLLKFAVSRMMQCQGSEPFIHAVNDADIPEYRKYIIQPMDLTMLEKNIKDNFYGSTQAFEADAKWILHNSIVFNSCSDLSLKSDILFGSHGGKRFQSKLTSVAKTVIKICKQEMSEIENCPSCYRNANTKKKTWFIEVCPKPHLLVWAKLRGFPFWPGKAMSCQNGMVDVRFFGAHDRAWVPEKECFLYTPKDPNLFRAKRTDIEQCVEELEEHVKNLKETWGEFQYPPFKTPIDPKNEIKQIQLLLPNYQPPAKEPSVKNEEIDPDDLPLKPSKKSSDDTCDDPMEGYGTDDESVAELDTETRKNLMNLNETHETDDYDTQVPCNVEADTTEDVPAKSNNSEPRSKRPSFDATPSRENSETKSDKFSQVTVAEDMEIGLDNDVSIVSSSNSDCSSDFSMEIRKKPVQVEINNVEYTISPTRKLKIADQLIKRIDDDKVDQVKKSLKNGDAVPVSSSEEADEPKNWTVTNVSPKSSTKIVFRAIKPVEETTNEEVAKAMETEEEPSTSNATTDEDKNKQKRKRSVELDDDSAHESHKKVLKSNDSTADRSLLKPALQLKKVLTPRTSTATDDVKSEPESESDQATLEAKKKYLSALNILEKGEVYVKKTKNKTNEIRTRSKTEEKRERSRIADNLAKAKEDAASTLKPVEPQKKKSDKSKPDGGEIFVKSFAKIDANESNVAPMVPTPPSKQRARKSFPQPNYGKPTLLANKSSSSLVAARSSTPSTSSGTSKVAPPVQQLEPIRPTNGYLILQPQQPDNLVFVSNNPTINFANPIQNQVMSMASCLVSASTSTQPVRQLAPQTIWPASPVTNEFTSNNSADNNRRVVNGDTHNETAVNESVPEVVENGDDNEVTVTNMDNITRTINDVVRRLPKLRPRPPGPLSQQFQEGTPSAAGPIAARINSVAYRLTDYFRGLLTETLEDFGKADNAEATITKLKLEIEQLKYQHSLDIADIEKNVSIGMKDLQRSMQEEKEKMIQQTRAACEAEAVKRVEEARSKQWCAVCSKEAQFYCCWNTSYCDYPCQQKHWPNHMTMCTQNCNQTARVGGNSAGGQQLILRPANPPSKSNVGQRLISKPLQKVYMNRTMPAPKAMRVQTSTGSVLTLMESTPGNYQFVTSPLIRAAPPPPNIKAKAIIAVAASGGSTKTSTSTKKQRNVAPVATVLDEPE